MIRHGQYEDGDKDADRCLSEKGRKQAKLCGQFLKSHVFNKENKQPTTFVHSTMLRATETAQIINEVLQVQCKVEVLFVYFFTYIHFGYSEVNPLKSDTAFSETFIWIKITF